MVTLSRNQGAVDHSGLQSPERTPAQGGRAAQQLAARHARNGSFLPDPRPRASAREPGSCPLAGYPGFTDPPVLARSSQSQRRPDDEPLTPRILPALGRQPALLTSPATPESPGLRWGRAARLPQKRRWLRHARERGQKSLQPVPLPVPGSRLLSESCAVWASPWGRCSVVPGSPAVAAAAMAASTAAGKQRIPKVAKVSGSGPCGRRPGTGLARPRWCPGREACGPGSWSSLPEWGPRAGRASRAWGAPPRPCGRRVRRCLSGGGERSFSTDPLNQTLARRLASG